jgi:hypothetical protein
MSLPTVQSSSLTFAHQFLVRKLHKFPWRYLEHIIARYLAFVTTTYCFLIADLYYDSPTSDLDRVSLIEIFFLL